MALTQFEEDRMVREVGLATDRTWEAMCTHARAQQGDCIATLASSVASVAVAYIYRMGVSTISPSVVASVGSLVELAIYRIVSTVSTDDLVAMLAIRLSPVGVYDYHLQRWFKQLDSEWVSARARACVTQEFADLVNIVRNDHVIA